MYVGGSKGAYCVVIVAVDCAIARSTEFKINITANRGRIFKLVGLQRGGVIDRGN